MMFWTRHLQKTISEIKVCNQNITFRSSTTITPIAPKIEVKKWDWMKKISKTDENLSGIKICIQFNIGTLGTRGSGIPRREPQIIAPCLISIYRYHLAATDSVS